MNKQFSVFYQELFREMVIAENEGAVIPTNAVGTDGGIDFTPRIKPKLVKRQFKKRK
jgi:hypothetical protein